MLETNSDQDLTSPGSYKYSSTRGEFSPLSTFPIQDKRKQKRKLKKAKNGNDLANSSFGNPKLNNTQLFGYSQPEQECNYKLLNLIPLGDTEASDFDGRYDYTPGDTWYGKEEDEFDKYKKGGRRLKVDKTATVNKTFEDFRENSPIPFEAKVRGQPQRNNPFLNSILKELKKQSRGTDYSRPVTTFPGKTKQDSGVFGWSQTDMQNAGFQFAQTKTKSPNSLPQSYSPNPFYLSVKPLRKDSKPRSITNTTTANSRSRATSEPRSRPQSDGKCLFPQSMQSDLSETVPTISGYSETLKNERAPKHGRKFSMETNNTNHSPYLSPILHRQKSPGRDEASIEKELTRKGLRKESDISNFSKQDSNQGEFSRTKKRHDTYLSNTTKKGFYSPTHSMTDKFNQSMTGHFTVSPEERKAELKKRRQEHVRQEKEKARFAIFDRKKRIQTLLKTRIVTKFDHIFSRLDTYQMLLEKNNKSVEDLKKH